MKNLLKIFALVAIMAVASCQEEKPATAVQGEYTFEDNTLSINDEVLQNMSELPGAAVSVTSLDEEKATFTLKNIILGYPEVVVPCDIVDLGTKAENLYAFSGIASGTGTRKISINGNIQGSKITMSVLDRNLSPLANKWMIGASLNILTQGMTPDFYLRFENPDVQEITIPGLFDEPVPVANLIFLANGFLPLIIQETPCSFIEFTEGGNLAFGDAPVIEEGQLPASTFSNIIKYYEETEKSIVNLYAGKSLIDMANGILAQKGFPALPSPLTLPIAYKVEPAKLNLNLNQEVFKPALQKASEVVATITLQQMQDLMDDPTIDEATFESIKGLVSGLLQTLLDEKTTFEVGANFVPYEEGPRPWEPAVGSAKTAKSSIVSFFKNKEWTKLK